MEQNIEWLAVFLSTELLILTLIEYGLIVFRVKLYFIVKPRLASD